MADPISLSSGLLTLIVFGLKSTTSLYQAINDITHHNRNIRDLRNEVQALSDVLKSLEEAAGKQESSFSALKLPLVRCTHACNDFRDLIVRSTTHTNGTKTSLRDWAKMKYLGDDVNGFRNTIGTYKSTIMIAIGDINLRLSKATTEVLEQYQEMIKETTADLEARLSHIDDQLQTLVSQGVQPSTDVVAYREEILLEKKSAQQCIDICIEVSQHIEDIQSKSFRGTTTSEDQSYVSVDSHATTSHYQQLTVKTLKECRQKLAVTVANLEARLLLFNSTDQRQKLQEELSSAKQSLAICAQASRVADQNRINFFEDIAMAEDGRQVIVSTIGDLISARKIVAGARSTQLLGQMSDASLQYLGHHHFDAAEQISKAHVEENTTFKTRYGSGHALGKERPGQ